jgi:hypothetical protein
MKEFNELSNYSLLLLRRSSHYPSSTDETEESSSSTLMVSCPLESIKSSSPPNIIYHVLILGVPSIRGFKFEDFESEISTKNVKQVPISEIEETAIPPPICSQNYLQIINPRPNPF